MSKKKQFKIKKKKNFSFLLLNYEHKNRIQQKNP